MDADNLALASSIVSQSYVSQGGAALAARRRLIKGLLSNRRLPQTGWEEATIQMLLQDAALMDSNTFPGQVGLGEREGRIACPLVAARHGRLAHGIGRSGDIAAEQPKAAGSSLLAKLAAYLAGDALRLAGLTEVGLPLVLPCATGMSLTLVLLAAATAAAAAAAPAVTCPGPAVRDEGPIAAAAAAGVEAQAQSGTLSADSLQQQQQQQQQQDGGSSSRLPPRFVIWSRIDQKTCLKAITAANLVPVVVELKRQGDVLVTDVTGIREAVERLGADQVVAVVTTTSCFAPRSSDDVVAVAKLCQQFGIPHIINNAYGVQAKALTASITAACRRGRVDAIVQSTDKNFMVPVGGAIVAAPEGKGKDWLVQAVAKNYPGRASMTVHLDLLITLLYWGASGWQEKLNQREVLFEYLVTQLGEAAGKLGERLLVSPGNPISVAMTLDGLAVAAAAANEAAAAAAANGRGSEGAGTVLMGNSSGASSSSTSGGKQKKKQAAAGVNADVNFFGAMLWARNVSGTRVLTGGKQQTVGGVKFQDYGCHSGGYPHPYMTAAAAIGGSMQDVDVFVVRLVKAYQELKDKWTKAAAATVPVTADDEVAAAVAAAEGVSESA